MTLLEKIDAVLESKHLKRADLSRMTGFSPSRISKWFSGEGVPSVYQAKDIADRLGVPLAWLADDQAEFPPPSEGDDMKVALRLIEQLGTEEAIRRLAKTPEPPRFVTDDQVPESVRDEMPKSREKFKR